MQRTKEQLIEEIRENLYENLGDDSDAVADALLDSHYPNLDSMTIEEVQRVYNFEFNVDDTRVLVLAPQQVYVLTDDLDHMSIHTTYGAALKEQERLNNEFSSITEMVVNP